MQKFKVVYLKSVFNMLIQARSWKYDLKQSLFCSLTFAQSIPTYKNLNLLVLLSFMIKSVNRR